MAVHFHPLTVKNIEKETPDCVSIAFDVPENLKDLFAFEHGQNITLKTTINGEEIRRSYSICAAPYENELRVAVKKVDGGKFSSFANNVLKEKDVIEVLPPTGKFNTKLNRQNKKNYVAFAAGSGITPVISIIKTTLQTEPESTFTLVYGNKSRGSIIFFEALEAIKNKHLTRFNLINILSREKTDTLLHFGRISPEKLNELSTLINYKNTHEFFICGPAEMIFSIKDFLSNAGIPEQQIHFELFAGRDDKSVSTTNSQKEKEQLPASKITIQLDGRSFDFDLAYSKESILDAALKQGADLPFACKGGVCCTCKARLLEGKVKMDVHWGLEQDEIEKGFILTCQSHPLTEKVVIDFDDRG